jgi:type IV secretory pathway TrbL component
MLRKLLWAVCVLIFLPSGLYVLYRSFDLTSPHIFVMMIFSGSLMVLLGLVFLVGLLAGGRGPSSSPPNQER